VLSCARRQYSLAVGKYNLSSNAASPALPPTKPAGPACLPPLPPLRPTPFRPSSVLSFSAVRQHDAENDDVNHGGGGKLSQEGDLRAELRAAAEGGEQDESDSNGDYFGHMEVSMLLG